MLTIKQLLICYLVAMIVFSLIAFFLYAIDKRKAVKGKMRIQEKVLLFFAVFFGSVGSLIGRIVAHHKTDKSYFSIVIYFSLLVNLATVVALFVLM